ncbi:hypothetical protein ORJ00_14135 [Rheinheimera baltica]|uniref:hypothetical protein n=1 Tax=Rheinheimera baltica TaxID=67576 RepID=UPI00273DA2EC|nr:hypothetical protein [Rheinheimera baltica]MDP5143889.1 hypothetical protein [Rheinheimera baltica]
MKLKALLGCCVLLISGALIFSTFYKTPDAASVQNVSSEEAASIQRPVLSNQNSEQTDYLVPAENSESPPEVDPLDYYSQALSLLASADDGDAKAQFQLAEILAHCNTLNAWKADFERDFPQFLAMMVSDADARYMENLMQEVQRCEQFIGQKLDVFSGQPLSGMQPMQVASVRYLNAALLGHDAAVVQAISAVSSNIMVDFDTKQLLAERLKKLLTSEAAQTYFELAPFQQSELSQIAMAKLGCSGKVNCDGIDSAPFPHIYFYSCMKSAVDDQIAGISTEPTKCTSWGINYYIAEQSTKYSETELAEHMAKIQRAAQQGDLYGMELSALADWLKTDDTKSSPAD